ncbi:MAG: HAMP domain-containing protein [Verrucomicrobia bacterium]|nr:HAMP domain-containing protein [Verrucomicrobiota bacterium]
MNAWLRRHTLRFRLAAWYAVGGTVLLAGFSATLYVFVADRMARPLAFELRQDLAEIQRRLTIQPGPRVLWDGRPLQARGRWNPEDPWFELWDERGELVRRVWPFADARVEQPPVAPARGRETVSIFNVARDIQLRVLSLPYPVPGHDEPWMIRVMTIHQPNRDALGALRLIIAVALPTVVALLVFGGYVVTRRWLHPLDEMAAATERITADDLSRRIPVANPNDELGRIAKVFNLTLERLELSFVALDRFVADASHELRTPLTTLRNVGEVGLRRSRTVEEYREIIGSMLEEAQRLQLLVQRLLELAAAEGGAPDVQRGRVRLDEFVSTCVAELGVLAESREQRIALETAVCFAITDPVLLRQALQNLIDNAVKYSPERSTIRVGVRAQGATCEVTVTDEGPGISAEHRLHLAERFYRPDGGRGRTSGGFGLGLALTKAYMRILGGELRYEPAQPRGSTFRLTLPGA